MTAGISTLLGFVVLIAWHTRIEGFIQVMPPSFVPMQYNTALGFVLCGLALATGLHGYRRAAIVLGACVSVIGILTLIEYILNTNLGIDQLLMEHYITVETSNPGRMAPNRALCFSLSGLSISFANGVKGFGRIHLGTLLLGAIVSAFGAVAIFGYIAGISTAYGWGSMTRMAIHTAIGFLVVGGGILSSGFKRASDEGVGLSHWIPGFVGGYVILVSLLLWQPLSAYEKSQMESLQFVETNLPEFVVVFCVLIGILLWLTFRFAQKAHLRSEEIERANEALREEISQRIGAIDQIERQGRILDGINRVLLETLTCESDKEVAQTCLKVAEELTESSFGFIGETNSEGKFDTVALSDPGWDACRMPESNAVVMIKNMEIRGIWADVILNGKPLIANEPDRHPSWVGTPQGHPDLTSFLGVPLKQGGSVTGMIAVANKAYGYTPFDEEALSGLSVAFAEALSRKRAEIELRSHREHLEELVRDRTEELTEANEQLKKEIADRKAMEGVLRENEMRISRSIIESPFPALIHAEDGEIILLSQVWTELTGYSSEEIPTIADWTEKAYGERKQEVRKVIDQLFEAGRTVHEGEFTIKTKKGDYRVWDFSSTPAGTLPDGRRLVYSIAVDITVRREIQQTLSNERNLLRTLIDTLPDYIYAKDSDSRFILNNKAHLEVLGADSQEKALSRNDFDFFPEELAQKYYADERDIIRSGEPLVNREEEAVGPAGQKLWVLTSKVPLRDQEGESMGIVGITRDITSLKEAEEALARKAEELTRSNEELEQFAYVASHDLQEPLRMISSYTQLLAERYKGKLDEDADDFIAFAVDGAERMKRLINDLLEYSRVTTRGKPFEVVDSQLILNEVRRNLAFTIEKAGATITCDSLPAVFADRAQLSRVFQNLISNAVKFRGEKPALVHIAAITGPQETIFSVRDNGIGIEPEYTKKIFAVFQRLQSRREYEGTGIGLAVCKKIIERHGGRIWVDSEVGNWSSFCFTIPEKGEGNV